MQLNLMVFFFLEFGLQDLWDREEILKIKIFYDTQQKLSTEVQKE